MTARATSTHAPEHRVVSTNGVELATWITGDGPTVVLVHGSLDDHRVWDRIVSRLAADFRVVTYDRRGHGASTCPPGQGRIGEDVDDLAGVIEAVGGDKPLVVGHSYGSSTTLLLGAHHPGLSAGLLVHEPPLFTLLADDPATSALAAEAAEHMRRAVAMITAGDVAAGVQHFVDNAAFGPGTWEGLFTDEIRRSCVAHADTWLDQSRDPDRLAVRPELLADYPNPIVISHGSASLPTYEPVARIVADALPRARRHVVEGAGHAPHLSHPAEFAELVRETARLLGAPVAG